MTRRPEGLIATAITALMLAFAPPAQADHLQSGSYPLRVHHEPGQEAFAEQVLAATESAWSYQIDEHGFLAPPSDAGANGSDDYDVFIEPTPYNGMCSVIGPAADRPQGLASQIVIDPLMPTGVLPLMLSHEFHHAVQAGICGYGRNLMEAGALYVSGMHHLGEAWRMGYFLGINAFQQAPERSLDWQNALGDFYPYGSGLFFLFLDEADADGAALGPYRELLAELYAHTDATATECPYYLAVLDEQVDLDASYATFARWRYFLGPADDGYHFSDLASWEGSQADQKLESVRLDQDLEATALPIVDVQPNPGPMPYGVSYARVALDGLAPDTELRLAFAGGDHVRWSVQSIVLLEGSEPVESSHPVDDSGATELLLPTLGGTHLVLAFVNLGDGQHAEHGSSYQTSDLSWSLSIDIPTDDGQGGAGGSGTAAPASDPDENAGSCAHVPHSPATGWWWVCASLGLALAAGRRARCQ